MSGKLLFISAGAGSGKTYRLTAILHEKLQNGSVRPEGVIATTFTKKAASELRERVRLHLLEQGELSLANAIGQARIGTVNSVCGKLLERFAFEAGLATEQQVLEETQATMLVKQAIDDVLDADQVNALWKLANKLGIEDWRKDLATLMGQSRSNDIDQVTVATFGTENAKDLLGYFPKPTNQDLTKALLEAVADALPSLAELAEKGGKKNTSEYLSLVRDVQRGLQDDSLGWGQWVKLSNQLPEKAAHGFAAPISTIAARAGEHPALHQDLTAYLETMFGLCSSALSRYADRKRSMGVVDFTDQEQLLLKVLGNPAVAQVLTDELDLLLVDEFQDTSPIQLALFLKLAEFAREAVWVGDIKQAIYGFRGSDTELMEAVLAGIRSWGAETKILGSSWRSRPGLVHLINTVFCSAFSGSLSPEQVALKPERPEIHERPAFGNWILAGKNKGLEDGALALGIKELIKSGYPIWDMPNKCIRPVRFGDIAILSRFNDSVVEVASHLRANCIPAATAQPGLLATPEIVFALACLRRLNDMADTVASAEIISMADGVEPEVWLKDRLEHIEADGDRDAWRESGENAHPLLLAISALRANLPVLSPREAMAKVIIACDVPRRVLQWTQDPAIGRIRLANLQALIAFSSKYEDACRSTRQAASISGLILWLNELSRSEQDDLAQPAIDAVNVITHHAAKGLEWPVVILMDLSAKVKNRLWSISPSARQAIDIQNPLFDRRIRYWPWPFGKQQKIAIYDDIALTPIAGKYQKAAEEENQRLLYVSMTRARDLLIFARSERNPDGEWMQTLNAPWLLSQTDEIAIQAPDGKSFDAMHWDLEAPQAPDTREVSEDPVSWFTAPSHLSTKAPLIFNPSSAKSEDCAVVAKVNVGTRIPISGKVDMALLGTALHACIAASMTDAHAPLDAQEIGRILAGHGLADTVTAESVLGQLSSLHAWIALRWPDARCFAEIPVEVVLDSGQVMQGRIDLLLETVQGWILLDHKSNPQSADHWQSIAVNYSGQMHAYAKAIEKTTGKRVLESWLYFPVSAGAVQLRLTL